MNKNSAIAILLAALLFGALAYLPRHERTSIEALAENGSSISMLFVGDMMFDRQVRLLMQENGVGYPFGNITETLAHHDAVVGNLEGPITTNASVTSNLKNKTLQFTFDPSVAKLIKNAGFTTVGLADNHTLNFGGDGLSQTRRFLSDAGISYYGSPSNATTSVLVKELNGARVAFIGYHEFTEVPAQNIIELIKATRPNVDLIVVSPHWGIEYKKNFTVSQQGLAHRFIDAGADAVIGAHPHVVEPIEIYKGRAIFYSLGNFIFDQNFSYDTTHGLAVAMNVSGDHIEYSLIPLEIKKSEPQLANAEDKEAMLDSLALLSVAPDSIKESIRSGIIRVDIKSE